MKNLRDIELTCHWHLGMKCRKENDCSRCENQPADEDKPNGKAKPIHIRFGRSEFGTIPECPACGEIPYSFERCIFCGQKFLTDENAEEIRKPDDEVREDCPYCSSKREGDSDEH